MKESLGHCNNEWESLTLDDDVGVEGGDPLGGDGLLVRVEVVEVAQGGDEAEADGDQHHWEPHPGQKLTCQLKKNLHLSTKSILLHR